jgi:hypothetical protein
MNEKPEIRSSPRIRTWFETHFSSQRQEGEGVLADVSYTGARVEDTGIRPSIGALAILYVCLPEDPKPFQLEGRVVRHTLEGRVARHTDAGFAIEYEKPDQDTRRGVDRIAEMVGPPQASPFDSSDSTPLESVEDDPSATQPQMSERPQLSRLDLTECEVSELEMLAERIASELIRRRDDSKRRVREEIEKIVAREGFSLEEVL